MFDWMSRAAYHRTKIWLAVSGRGPLNTKLMGRAGPRPIKQNIYRQGRAATYEQYMDGTGRAAAHQTKISRTEPGCHLLCLHEKMMARPGPVHEFIGWARPGPSNI